MDRSPFPVRSFLILVIVTLTGFRSAPSAGLSRYFPATGEGARHQIARDLLGGAVVLSIAPEPGDEDMQSLAALRLESGARVFSAYLSDGGATASDLSGDLPVGVAARKKYEAYNAMSLIGADALFLNFPDYGIVSSAGRLEQLWDGDSLIVRMAGVIRSCRPDLILLARDARTLEGDTVRSILLRTLLTAAVDAAGRVEGPGTSGAGIWRVPRVLEETGAGKEGISADVERVHPIWKKTYRQIGNEAALAYGSLRYQIARWNADRARSYRAVYGERSEGPGLLSGLPVMSPALEETSRDVYQAAAHSVKGNGMTALPYVADAIARIANTVSAHRSGLPPADRRVLAGWEENLESLRCAVLNIDLRFVQSDTLLAKRQLFTLRFPRQGGFPRGGHSEIIFPTAVDSAWLINRSSGYVFRFALPDTVVLITPEFMGLNRPLSSNGLDGTALYTSVPFIVVHRDADRLKNFACRRQIRFAAGPVQTAEILTPVLRVISGERLVVRLQSISHNGYKGMMSMGDSVIAGAQVPVILPRKDDAVTDTLPCVWKEGVQDGDYRIALRIGKGPPVGLFTARKFRADVDTSRVVGLVTAITSSPVSEALRRLRVTCLNLESSSFGNGGVRGLHTIIIDRNAFAMRPDGAALAAAVTDWVRAGGHCVLLQQGPGDWGRAPLLEEVGFGAEGAIPPERRVVGQGDSPLLLHPNAITAADWQEWIISRARSPLRLRGGAGPVVHVRDEFSGEPLLASVSLGKGEVTVVALDLSPQLQIVHPGAFRLLANLVSY